MIPTIKWTTLALVLVLCSILACQKQDEQRVKEEVGISIDSLVRRVVIPAQSMGTVYNAHVILPESYYLDSSFQSYPVVYLLHGYSGSFSDFYKKMPQIRTWASDYDMIIVCPEGSANGWYLDSEVKEQHRFFTYITQEVPNYIDSNFRTYTDGRYRAIAGLSMGGHGALSMGLSLPDWFGAVGSMSGMVDLRPFQERWELSQVLGDFKTDSLNWAKHSVVEMLSKQKNKPKMIIDCGTEDELIAVNRNLHQRLLDMKVPHTYIERAGGHSWLYWEEALFYQLQFFNRVFKEG